MNTIEKLIPGENEFCVRFQPTAQLASRLLVSVIAINYLLMFAHSLLLIRKSGRSAPEEMTLLTVVLGFWVSAFLAMLVWACIPKSGHWYVQKIGWLTLCSAGVLKVYNSWLRAFGFPKTYTPWAQTSAITTLVLLFIVAIPIEMTFSDFAKRKKEEAG